MTTINIYDGNNVRLRDMSKSTLPGATRLGLRQQFEQMWENGPHIWVWDGKDHNERRRAVYPDYKLNRTPLAEDKFSQIQLFKTLLKHSPAAQVCVSGWEADDVVSTLARRFAAQGHTVVCHSNDLDYAQLEANPNITINGIQNRPCEPQWIPLYKALRGDTSDNIKGLPGFGPKSWEALADCYGEIQLAIVRGDIDYLRGLPFPKRVLPYLEDLEELQTMLLITHFYEVPAEEIAAGTTVGAPDREAAEKILERYFL